jgi:2-polyprenyl-6-methoxyphenol hydroxylase-like FAD-dependent oxidoreductase
MNRELRTQLRRTAYDVAIVGSGVAGGALAVQLSGLGYKVALIEKRPLGCYKLSTHFLWPRGTSYLRRLGIDPVLDLGVQPKSRIFFSLEGIEFRGEIDRVSLNERFVEAHGDTKQVDSEYTCVKREILDFKLNELAQMKGVDFYDQTEVVDLQHGNNASFLTIKNKLSNCTTLSATVVAAADGRESSIAALVKNKKAYVSNPSTAALWAYYRGVPEHNLRLAKQGVNAFGAAKTNDGLSMVLYWGKSADKKNVFSLNDDQFRRKIFEIDPEFGDLLSNGKREGAFYRASDIASFKRSGVKANVYFLGDAYCFKDQCTASGITHALSDAEFARESIDQFLKGTLDRICAEAMFETRRAADRDPFFLQACEMASMKVISEQERQQMIEVSRDQRNTDIFLAQISDSAPIESNLAERKGVMQ